MQSVVFLVFAGLMLATVKGRNSFHDATDILRLTLNDSSAIFTTMETASAQMAAQSAALDGGFATLTDCPSGHVSASQPGTAQDITPHHTPAP